MNAQACQDLAELVRSQPAVFGPEATSVLADFCAFHNPGLDRSAWLDAAGLEE